MPRCGKEREEQRLDVPRTSLLTNMNSRVEIVEGVHSKYFLEELPGSYFGGTSTEVDLGEVCWRLEELESTEEKNGTGNMLLTLLAA